MDEVTKHNISGTTMTLLEPFDALTDAVDAGGPIAVDLAPGCALNPTTCNAFNNIANYGGFPYFPVEGAFDGSSIV